MGNRSHAYTAVHRVDSVATARDRRATDRRGSGRRVRRRSRGGRPRSGHAEAASDRRSEVGDEPGAAALPDLLDGRARAGLGVVVVVADGDGPARRVLVSSSSRPWARASIVDGAERVVVDGSAQSNARLTTTERARCGAASSVDASAPEPARSTDALASSVACRNRARAAGCRCGSCARPGGRCPSTGRCGATGSILDAIRDPDLAAEITLQPVRRYGVDAAILYSDIVVPVAAIGFGVDIDPGRRARSSSEPFRGAADLDRLRPLEPEADMPLRRSRPCATLVGELGDVPLIGFAGAPFTVASYLIEGGPSRTYGAHQGADATASPTLWPALLDRLADMAIASLRAQVEAGASAHPAVRLAGPAR